MVNKPFFKIYISIVLCFILTIQITYAQNRVLSTGLCADAYVLEFIDKDKIIGLTKGAGLDSISAYVDEAQNVNTHNGTVEQILALKPDMVIGDLYTRPKVKEVLQRLNIPFYELPTPNKLADWKILLKSAGKIFNQPQKAKQKNIELNTIWQKIIDDSINPKPIAAIFRPGGYSPGSESLAGDAIKAIGLQNLSTKLNYKNTIIMPLESLIYYKPQILIRDMSIHNKKTLSDILLQHPAFVQYVTNTHSYQFDLKYWFCLSPKTLPAILNLKEKIMSDLN